MTAHLRLFTSTASKSRPPSEGDMVTADGELVASGIEAVARWRAVYQFQKYADEGIPLPFSEVLATERKVARDSAECIAACRKGRKQVQGLPLKEQLIRSLEYELYKAENGLGMPFDHDLVKRIKAKIAEARAS